MEKEIALSSLHCLFTDATNEKNKNEFITLMLHILLAPFNDHEMKEVITYVRNVFFLHHPIEAKRIWVGLIKYAKFKKSNPRLSHQHDQKEIDNALKKEGEFVDAIAIDTTSIDLLEINFEDYEAYLLARAFVMVPYNLLDNEYYQFIKHLLPQVLEDLKLDENYSFNRNKKERNLHHESTLAIEIYIAGFLLNGDPQLSKPILKILATPALELPMNADRDDLYKFIAQTLNYVVLNLFDNGNSNSKPSNYKEQVANFWQLWEMLYSLVLPSTQKPFIVEYTLSSF
ncbi:hypothetical protein [Aquimarina algiphila]|uniref:Uncharacterized protein n=1 Tax=Aquimarina algiphila TaxID=2047982 RepID=A0A554VAN6_9FLAO|nr:hypothetical protein [Aquimarina algiphila]TSE03271.1 hypothetical protein FOF46_29670 [Aquimarina algiphila]